MRKAITTPTSTATSPTANIQTLVDLAISSMARSLAVLAFAWVRTFLIRFLTGDRAGRVSSLKILRAASAAAARSSSAVMTLLSSALTF